MNKLFVLEDINLLKNNYVDEFKKLVLMGGKAINKYIKPFERNLNKSFDFDMHLMQDENAPDLDNIDNIGPG